MEVNWDLPLALLNYMIVQNVSDLPATKSFLQQKSEEVRMPTVLETDDTKCRHNYKETDGINQTFKN